MYGIMIVLLMLFALSTVLFLDFWLIDKAEINDMIPKSKMSPVDPD